VYTHSRLDDFSALSTNIKNLLVENFLGLSGVCSQCSTHPFIQSHADPSLWIPHGENGAHLSMFYVDDGLVPARAAVKADALVGLVHFCDPPARGASGLPWHQDIS
jgi:hypothetical protein